MILNLLKKDNKNKTDNENVSLVRLVALLIHAAKIDENYSEREKKIIMEFVVMSSENDKNQKEVVDLLKKAEDYENNSNQILEYTREVKKMSLNTKKLVLEFLWKIILSDDKSDVYESNLMRRICGLLYVPDKLSGEIKLNILKGKSHDVYRKG
tara:strand:- start:41 stop:502 length:462 start_codon:yes stop_codon:yes gene_type:complete